MLRYFHPLVLILLTGTIFVRTASFMTVPFLAIYLQSELEASPVIIGLTIGIAPLVSTFTGFIGGYLADKVGRKAIILISMFLWSLVFVGFASVKIVELFIVLSALNGLCRSFFETSTQALMVDFTEDDKKRRLFSFRYTAINIAAVIGPIVGVTIAQMSSAAIPFYITGAMYFIYALFLMVILNRYEMHQELLGQSKRIQDVVVVIGRDRQLVMLLVGGIFILVGYSQFDSTLPQYINSNIENGVRLFSVLIVVNAAVVLVFQLPLSILMERLSLRATLYVGIIFFALGIGLFGFADSYVVFIIGMVIFTIGEVCTFPTMNVLIENIAPKNQKGTYLGASQLKNIGSFLGPVFGGLILVQYEAALYFIIAVLVVISMIFYKQAFRNMENSM